MGVAASALSVGVWQGLLTVIAVLVGDVMSAAMLAGPHRDRRSPSARESGCDLLNLKSVPVGDMLPALIVAPLLTVAVAALV